MQYFYDGQIRRYLLQVVRLLSNILVKYQDGTLVRVPVMYGDMDRQVANIINQNSENNLNSAPRIAVYITGIELDRNRLGDSSYVGKVHIREREFELGDDGEKIYNSNQGENYTVERLMPTPYKMTLKVDIWSTSTEQKLQILEQLLTLFNPSLEIQTTDNYVDWTSLSVVDLTDIGFTSRSVPVGTQVTIDIASLTLETPIYITPPAKVKRLGIVTNIIASVFGTVGDPETGYIDGLGVDIMGGTAVPSDPILNQKTTIGNFDIIVVEGQLRLISSTDPGSYLAWSMLLEQHPGKYKAGLSKIYLLQEDGSYVIGYVSISPLDDTIMIVNWDSDTYPGNTSIITGHRDSSPGTFDAIIDPTKTKPSNVVEGTRYLIIESIGGGVRDTFVTSTRTQRITTNVEFDRVNSCTVLVGGVSVGFSANADADGNYTIRTTQLIPIGSTVTYVINLNADGPDAWKNSDDTDFIAEANDIIEWDGTHWQVIFSAEENTDTLIYQTNIFTGVQYKWNGVSWVKSFEGEYRRGEWRLEL